VPAETNAEGEKPTADIPGEVTTDAATKDVNADAPAPEKKSFFASMCGCLGGSSPPADKDAKDKPVETKAVETKAVETGEADKAGEADKEAEKEEVETAEPQSPEQEA